MQNGTSNARMQTIITAARDELLHLYETGGYSLMDDREEYPRGKFLCLYLQDYCKNMREKRDTEDFISWSMGGSYTFASYLFRVNATYANLCAGRDVYLSHEEYYTKRKQEFHMEIHHKFKWIETMLKELSEGKESYAK